MCVIRTETIKSDTSAAEKQKLAKQGYQYVDSRNGHEIWQRKEYTGAVLCAHEQNYAVVWDETASKLIKVDSSTNSIGVDATEDVREKATRWLADWFYSILKGEYLRTFAQADMGKKVRVVKGRVMPHGTEGEVVWVCMDKNKDLRARVDLPDKRYFWIDTQKLEVLKPEQYLPTDEEIQAEAECIAQRSYKMGSGWHIPFTIELDDLVV